MRESKKVFIFLAIVILVLVLLVVASFYFLKSKNGIPKASVNNIQTQEKIEETNSTPKKDYKTIANELEQKVVSGIATVDDVINLGIAKYNLKQYDQAIKYYNQAIVQDSSKSAMLYNSIGNILRDQKKYQEAEDSYRKAISIDSRFTTSYINLANMLYPYEDNKDLAIAVLQEGVNNNPDDQNLKKLLAEYIK